MKKSLSIPFIILFFIMLATTVWASLNQNLFTEFSFSNSPEWFKATLIDFYINQFILWIGVVVLEKSILKSFIWFAIFMCLGSMGTCLYIILKILKNKRILSVT